MDATEPRDELIRRRLAAPLGGKAGSEHPDAELVAAHACNELSPEYALAITRHLTVCDDGRCNAILRDAVAGAAVARDALYGRLDAAHDGGSAPMPPLKAAGDGGSLSVPPAEGAASEPPGPPAATDHPGSPALPPARPASISALLDQTAPDAAGLRERVIECDDEIWEAFEAMAGERGRPIDLLIDEAMEAYAQARVARAAEATPLPPQRLVAPREVTLRDMPGDGARPSFPRERNTPTMPRAYLPRAPASSRRSPVPALAAAAGHLSVVVEGVRYEVTKERFVVGRGGRASDLAIDDPGVSRQHALIERAGGAYYLVDMGSTNGVEYQGERIARKEIAHGDRFRIGDHELEFLFG